jgi:cysteine desulfurase/selenocysteine lyase
VYEDRITYGEPPHKFEAGTPSIVQAIGLGAAIDYVGSIGKARIRAHETELMKYAHDRLREINSLRIIGTARDKGAIVLVRDEGRASARCRDYHRPFRRRGTRRHPLRDAVAGAFRRHRHLPRIVCALQHQAEVDRLAEALIKAQEFFA